MNGAGGLRRRLSGHVGDDERHFAASSDGLGGRLVPISVAVELVEPRLECLAVLLELGLDGPVLLRHELPDLLFALANQSQGHRLHPPRRQAGLDALPQQRAGLVAHQPIEDAPRLLRVDFLLVDVERIRDRVGHRVFGDFVKQDATHLAAVAELRRDVPGNRLAFAVGVGRDQHAFRALRRFLDFGEGLRLFLDRHVLGGEAVVDVHAEFPGRQVADVPHGRLHSEAAAEVLPDRLGLGGRFDDDQRAATVGRPPCFRKGALGGRRGGAPAARRFRLPGFRLAHTLLLNSHRSTSLQIPRHASLPTSPAARKSHNLGSHFRRPPPIGLNLRLRLNIERLALAQQLAHLRRRVLS
jgi:hypothetical protein